MTQFLSTPTKYNNLSKWTIIECFFCFSVNMTSWWLSYELHFRNKTTFKFTAQYKLENLQLQFCLSHSNAIANLKRLLRENLFQKFAFHDVMAAIVRWGNITKISLA